MNNQLQMLIALGLATLMLVATAGLVMQLEPMVPMWVALLAPRFSCGGAPTVMALIIRRKRGKMHLPPNLAKLPSIADLRIRLSHPEVSSKFRASWK